MFCPMCGTQNYEAKFCQSCGAKLNQPGASATSAASAAPAAPPPAPPAQPMPYSAPRAEADVRQPPPPPSYQPPPGIQYGPGPIPQGLRPQQDQPAIYGQVGPGYGVAICQFEYGGFWRRFFAMILDAILLGVVASGIGAALGMVWSPRSRNSLETLMIVSYVLQFAISFLYFTIRESSKEGATFGKMLLGIKVTDLQGNRISYGKACIRYFGKIISSIILCIGYIMAAFTEKRQGLHDIIAGTLVVRKR